ncbi:MAG: trypsin-like peptidase domain-containing protein [Actinomycetota bacterium]
MSEEERPPGGQERWAPGLVPDPTGPVDPRVPADPTVPLQHMVPVEPTVPLQHPLPVPSETAEPVSSYPPPTGSPFLYQSPAQVQPPPTVGSQATAPPLDRHDPGTTGAQRLGAGAISAIVAGAVAIAMVAALFGGVAGAFLATRGESGEASLPPSPVGSVARPSGSIADVAARILPAVVTIKVEGPAGAGTGSGFVMRKDGYILTNNHVVDAATAKGKITVLFSDGKRSDATIIGHDESYDLAVIRVDRDNLPVLVLGKSSDVRVGDEVIAVGAPLGLDSTVTSGIVSALNRPVTAGGAGASSASFINAIQTDAAINPGNSGGPLLDMAGRVIGVNSAIARVASSQGTDGQSGNIGVGFAIPSDQVRKTAEQLIANGKATHPVIGVLIDTAYTGEGVRIAAASQNGSAPITKGGPADKAGLLPGDVILTFEGRPVTDPDQFVVAVRARSVGETVQLTVRHGSKERTVRMKLQAAN